VTCCCDCAIRANVKMKRNEIVFWLNYHCFLLVGAVSLLVDFSKYGKTGHQYRLGRLTLSWN